jgi:HAD superfamily hydrolase (TIGR01458 family)
VVVGDVREVLDYPLLDAAFRAVRAGAQLIALQRGRYFKRDDGDHIDTGAVVAALEYAAGVEARVVGKPSVDFFAGAAASAGVPLSDCLVVGDDATTDVAGGRAAGARTVQVRTGKYADQVQEGLPVEADAVVDSVVQLPDRRVQSVAATARYGCRLSIMSTVACRACRGVQLGEQWVSRSRSRRWRRPLGRGVRQRTR